MMLLVKPFDKFAKVLGLPYPGGPSIEKCAKFGSSQRFKFPQPMARHKSFEFSFSGLKTHASLEAAKHTIDEKTRCDLAFAFQEAAVGALISKSRLALEYTGYRSLVVAGGVSANQLLRKQIQELVHSLNGEAYFPSLQLCTDNGAMIAYAGFLRLRTGYQESLSYDVRPRWSLDSLPPIQL